LLVAVLLVAAAGAGVWWRSRSAAASARTKALAIADTELAREPLDRGGLVQVERDLERLARSDPDPTLRLTRARVALALRLPDKALQTLDQTADTGPPSTQESWVRAKALALRHAIAGRIDDAVRAANLAFEGYEATHEIPMAVLAWQCATRVDERALVDTVVSRLAADAPDAWETRVMQALHEFDPERPDAVGRVRELQDGGPELLELQTAVAAADVLSEDETLRQRGLAAIQRVLEQVPSSKPARLVAVLACDRTGDAMGRRAHLQWLVDNFPGDPRAEAWRALLAKG